MEVSYFWPLLCEDGRHWNTFAHDWVVLPKFKQLFVRGKAKNGLLGVRESSLCALVSSYLRGFLYQVFVLMTVAVASSVAYVRVFCIH